MRSSRSLFRVIVLGGIGLTSAEACGGITTTGQTGASGSGGFPIEGVVDAQVSLIGTGGSSAGGGAGSGGFPMEGTGGSVLDSGAGGWATGGFPTEGAGGIAGISGGASGQSDAGAHRDAAASAGTGGFFPQEGPPH